MESLITWTNENSGFLSLILFVVALLLGWVSGIFSAIKRKPKLQIRLIEGPTMVSTFQTGRKHNGHETHRTAISLYLDVTNIGSAPTDISNVQVAYRNYITRNPFRWFWFENRTLALSDFRVEIGDNFKYYPFLNQVSSISPRQTDSFLEIGKKAVGIVYFEQEEAWGGYRPRVKDGIVRIKIRIYDSFGKKHTRIEQIPMKSIDKAKEFNKDFGQTQEALNERKNLTNQNI